jgi:predicted transcriptional regulator
MTETSEKLRELVAEVAAAYFSNSHVGVSEISSVVSQIALSLSTVGEGGAGQDPSSPGAAQPEPVPMTLTPAQIRKSIKDEGLVSFEDGRTYKTLKRHLAVRGLTPAEYREKWGLTRDYPMVAPSYSAKRSALAKSLGLGQKSLPRVRKAVAITRKSAKPAQA